MFGISHTTELPRRICFHLAFSSKGVARQSLGPGGYQKKFRECCISTSASPRIGIQETWGQLLKNKSKPHFSFPNPQPLSSFNKPAWSGAIVYRNVFLPSFLQYHYLSSVCSRLVMLGFIHLFLPLGTLCPVLPLGFVTAALPMGKLKLSPL